MIEHLNGGADVLVNSIPVVLAGGSRGVEVRVRSEGDSTLVDIRVADDGTILEINSGRLGGLLRQRDETVNPVIDQLNTFAGQLINQVNRLHSQGQAKQGFESITGSYINNDTTANLNASATGLPFTIDNGSFMLHVTNTQTGLRTTHQINVNGNADSLDDLVARINAATGTVTAGLGLGNVLTLDAADGYQMSFSDDTSGALAAFGINTFFAGQNASDIEVRSDLRGNPDMLAADSGHVRGSGGNAVTLANLQNAALDALGGATLREYWQNSVNELAVKANAANAAVDSTQLVSESLNAQIQAVSGVSLDEEAVNLMTYQRQYQAAARFITVIDEMLQTLLSIA
jgi:flagellar hook-associated protein 1 FlgK